MSGKGAFEGRMQFGPNGAVGTVPGEFELGINRSGFKEHVDVTIGRCSLDFESTTGVVFSARKQIDTGFNRARIQCTR